MPQVNNRRNTEEENCKLELTGSGGCRQKICTFKTQVSWLGFLSGTGTVGRTKAPFLHMLCGKETGDRRVEVKPMPSIEVELRSPAGCRYLWTYFPYWPLSWEQELRITPVFLHFFLEHSRFSFVLLINEGLELQNRWYNGGMAAIYGAEQPAWVKLFWFATHNSSLTLVSSSPLKMLISWTWDHDEVMTHDDMMSCVPISQPIEYVEEALASDLRVFWCTSGHAFRLLSFSKS